MIDDIVGISDRKSRFVWVNHLKYVFEKSRLSPRVLGLKWKARALLICMTFATFSYLRQYLACTKHKGMAGPG